MTEEWETSKGFPEIIDKEDLEHFTEVGMWAPGSVMMVVLICPGLVTTKDVEDILEMSRVSCKNIVKKIWIFNPEEKDKIL